MKQEVKFIFDLDGTVTKQETLPIIAEHFKKQEEINELTKQTVRGNVPFIESFIKRIYILGKFPVDEINTILGDVELYDQVVDFISNHKEDCIIATGNLKCWTRNISGKIGCEFYGSVCDVENNEVSKLTKILRKERVVEKYKNEGFIVVFVGDGNNDLEGMRLADVSIATGLTHEPAASVLSIADYVVYTEEALCRILNQLC